MEIISAKQAREKSMANKPKITPEEQDKDLSVLTYVMDRIKDATAQGVTETKILSHIHEIQSNSNKEKSILIDVCAWVLDEDRETKKRLNSKTYKTLKENGFNISKEQYKNYPIDFIFIVKISW